MAFAQFDYPRQQASETATVRVNNRNFSDWETVLVESSLREPWPTFKFTAAEDSPTPVSWPALQFKPDDLCAIYLGGLLAVSGIILTRQTAYNADSHAVMLAGAGITWRAARSSHVDSDGNFDGLSYQQIVERVLKPFGIGAVFVGNISSEPFQEAQIQKGEEIWAFFERLGRNVGIVVGSDRFGNFVFIGDHVGNVAARLVEGENILSCVAVISVENIWSEFRMQGQIPASDDTHGTAASEQEAIAPGLASRYSPLLTPAEQPVSPSMLQLRADHESKWSSGTLIRVTAVVQGWFTPDGLKLWTPGDDVSVYSPSAMLDDVLVIEKVAFSQDRERGTLTTLDLVVPWLLNDLSDFNLGSPRVPQRPGPAVRGDQPAETPPAQPVPQPPSERVE